MHSSSILSKRKIEQLISGKMADPFTILGAHPVLHNKKSVVAVRVFLPGVHSVSVLDLIPNEIHRATQIDDHGFFEVILPGVDKIVPYRLRVDFNIDLQSTFYDCYSFSPLLTEYDLYLFNQGNHTKIYEKLGAHLVQHQGISGVLFAVWAPSASRVSVIGDFNQWDGQRHFMRSRGTSGIWELFIPHLKPGMLYKFEIRTQKGELLIKADPFAFRFEKRPKTAAIVHDLDQYKWHDQAWMTARDKKDHRTQPISVFEVHLGSWRRMLEDNNRWLSYRECADELISYVKEMGFNYIEFLPLSEHPFDGSWGYQVTGYYAATSRFGSPEDLMYLIDQCHAHEIGIIFDWVPAHFPRDAYALEFFDGTHLFEHADPRQKDHKDWDTLIFNYGRNEVRNFLVANALFWFEKYHIDGLRIDAVASMLYLDYSRQEGEWIPNEYGGRENLEAIRFIKNVNRVIYEHFPGAITIAEESTAWPGVTLPAHLGGLGFLFKWNMGWMHDILTFMTKDPIHRRYHMEKLSFTLLYAFNENFMLPLSHDEVVHGKSSLLSKMPGDDWQKFANLRLLFGYMFAEPGKKILFMGGEFAQREEWNHDQSLQWHLLEYEPHRKLQKFVKDLHRVYYNEPAMYELDFDSKGFEWIDFRDTDHSVISFIRRGKKPDQFLVFIFNFTPIPRNRYRVGAPKPGFYKEILNSDASCYGGASIGLGGDVRVESLPWHGRDYSFDLNLPPLGMIILKPE